MTQIRGRISHKTNRARVKLQLRRSMGPVAVYLTGLAVAAAAVVFIGTNLPGGAGLTATRQVAFEVPDATGIVTKRAEVRLKGIPVGTISDVRIDDGTAILTAAIKTKYGKIYRNATTVVRPNTPLQDMYVDILERGTPAAGEATASRPLAETRTQSSVNVSDVLQVFDADTRTQLANTLSQFGEGLDGQGEQLRQTFVSLVPFLQVAGRLSHQIDDRQDKTRRLIHNTTLLTSELGRRNSEIRTLLTDGDAVVKTLQAGSADLDRTIAELPSTLAGLDTSFTALRGVLPDVDNALRMVDPVAKELPNSLSSVRKLSAAARPAVVALRPSVRSLTPLAGELKPAAAELATAARALRPQTGALDHATASVAKCSFTIQRFFQWTQSVFSMGDARGEAPRGDAALGVDTSSFFRDPRVVEADTCVGGRSSHGVQPVIRP